MCMKHGVYSTKRKTVSFHINVFFCVKVPIIWKSSTNKVVNNPQKAEVYNILVRKVANKEGQKDIYGNSNINQVTHLLNPLKTVA